MAKFRRARRAAAFVRKTSRRKAFGGGVLGDVLAGAAVGVVLHFGAPTINAHVPSIGPVRPTTAVMLGLGAAGKFMHKGGKYADAALILGSAMAVSDVAGSFMGSAGNSAYEGPVYG